MSDRTFLTEARIEFRYPADDLEHAKTKAVDILESLHHLCFEVQTVEVTDHEQLSLFDLTENGDITYK